MISSLKKTLKGLMVVPAIALAVSFAAGPLAVPAHAGFNETIDDGAGAAQSDSQPTNLFADNGVFKTITNVLLFLIGAVSVIMLIIGGIRYTLSGGDQTAVTAAKNTILYAVIGIIVALLAFAIVNFVLGSFSETA